MPIKTILSLEARQFPESSAEPKEKDIIKFVQASTEHQRFYTGAVVSVCRVVRPPWRRKEFIEIEVEMLQPHDAPHATLELLVAAKAGEDVRPVAGFASG